MIQTHLMKLEAPYPVLNIDGQIVRHVATLIEVREVFDPKTGEEKIQTISHPVVDFGDNRYSGVVYEEKNLEDCDVLQPEISQVDFHLMVHDAQRMFNPLVISQKPEHMVKRLRKFGIDVEWPMKKDAEGYDTNEPEDRIEVSLSIGQTSKGTWAAESSIHQFCFDAKDMKSEKELLQYIRDMRSSYYKAFPERKFDIVFCNNKPEAKRYIDELNQNPHL